MRTKSMLTPCQRFHFYMDGWHDGAGMKQIAMADSDTGSVLYLEGYQDGRKDGGAKADAAGNRFNYQQSTIRLAAPSPAPVDPPYTDCNDRKCGACSRCRGVRRAAPPPADIEALIAEAEKLCAGATVGPWVGRGYGPSDSYVRITKPDGCPDDPVCDVGHNVTNRDGDAAFIARSRTLIPELLMVIHSLLAQVSGSRVQS